MNRSRALEAVAVAGVVLLAGCGSESGLTVLRSDGVVALVDSSSGAGMDAQVVGVLALSTSGCLVLDEGSGTGKPVIWPHGTTLDGNEVVLASDERLVVGDEVSGSGGEIPAADGGELPEECPPVDGMVLRLHEVAAD